MSKKPHDEPDANPDDDDEDLPDDADDDAGDNGAGDRSVDDDLDDRDLDESVETAVSIDITGLSVYTHHGVSAAEQEVGQRLLIDISFELELCDATVTDELDDTVDYGAVCEQVWLAAQKRSYKTLERLCSAICDHLMDHFNVDAVMVRATKPEPPIPLPVGDVSVEVWKER
jgi:dihydroneopterin aldolase